MAWHDDLIANVEAKPLNPQTFYSKNGDVLEVFFDNGAYSGKRIDGLVTIYVSDVTGKPIGILLKGVTSFLKQLQDKMPNVAIDFSGENFRIEYLITAYIWTRGVKENGIDLLIKVRDLAKDQELEFDRQQLLTC